MEPLMLVIRVRRRMGNLRFLAGKRREQPGGPRRRIDDKTCGSWLPGPSTTEQDCWRSVGIGPVKLEATATS